MKDFSPGMAAIITRAYLADPEATERDLIDSGHRELVTPLRIDHENGRLAANYAAVTGKRVLSEAADSEQSGKLVAAS